jgi:hypothetical protein
MRLRLLLLVGSSILAACDPVRFAAIQVAPRPKPDADSTSQVAAFAIAERVARLHGLMEIGQSNRGPDDWIACFGEQSLFLCWKVKDREAQFQIREWAIHLSPLAEGVRDDLIATLRAQFGSVRVRECTWRGSGCAPLALPDSG